MLLNFDELRTELLPLVYAKIDFFFYTVSTNGGILITFCICFDVYKVYIDHVLSCDIVYVYMLS